MRRSKRNFGYGRKPSFAAKSALREKFASGHFATVAAHTRRFDRFLAFIKQRYGTEDLRDIRAEQCIEYGLYLRETDHSIAYQHNLISSVNVVMSYLRSHWPRQSPLELIGKHRDNQRRTVPNALDLKVHDQAVTAMRDAGKHRAAALTDLARFLGVRSREAVLANLSRWQKEVERYSAVDIQEGTKGGRDCPRWVPVGARQRMAIQRAAEASPAGSNNLLWVSESYKDALNGWISSGRRMYSALTGGDRFRDCRAAYACERYRELTGYDAPVVAGERKADRESDRAARQRIAYELGHHRKDVTKSYCGGVGHRK